MKDTGKRLVLVGIRRKGESGFKIKAVDPERRHELSSAVDSIKPFDFKAAS